MTTNKGFDYRVCWDLVLKLEQDGKVNGDSVYADTVRHYFCERNAGLDVRCEGVNTDNALYTVGHYDVVKGWL